MNTQERLEKLQCIVEMMVATSEAMGQELKPSTIAVMAEDLVDYSLNDVYDATTRCRRELRGRLTLADIIERLESADGRLSGDEAWPLIVTARDETQTVVWTDEIELAASSAWPILQAGDKVGARMAFLRAYERVVRESRAAGKRQQVRVSLGTDQAARVCAIEAAIEAGRLIRQDVQHLLPAPAPAPGSLAAHVAGLLAGSNVVPHPKLNAARCEELRRVLKGAADSRERREKARKDGGKARRAQIEAKRDEVLSQIDALMEHGAGADGCGGGA